MRKIVIAFAGVFLLLTAFQQPKNSQWVDYHYSPYGITLHLPGYLKQDKITDEHNLKNISFSDPARKINMMLFIDSKEEVQRTLVKNHLENKYKNDLNFYTVLRLAGFNKEFTVTHLSDPTPITVNGMKGIFLTANASMLGPEELYTLAFVEGKEQYYHFMISIPPNKQSSYEAAIREIMYSLREQ